MAGAGIFFYPTFSDMWNQYRNALLISNYDQAVSDLSADNYEKLWKEAEEYNAEHPVNSIVDAFDEEEDYEPTHPYDEVLDPNGDGLMGSIEIPRDSGKAGNLSWPEQKCSGKRCRSCGRDKSSHWWAGHTCCSGGAQRTSQCKTVYRSGSDRKRRYFYPAYSGKKFGI